MNCSEISPYIFSGGVESEQQLEEKLNEEDLTLK
jgi:hypothetical protein